MQIDGVFKLGELLQGPLIVHYNGIELGNRSHGSCFKADRVILWIGEKVKGRKGLTPKGGLEGFERLGPGFHNLNLLPSKFSPKLGTLNLGN